MDMTEEMPTKKNPFLFLTAEWRDLVMINFEIDPGILEPYIPTGTELDFHKDRTFVSLVGFLFLNTRVKGIAIPGHRNFEEVNLRFYVKRPADASVMDGEVRRGVVFLKEIVPRRAIAWLARTLYGEQYIALPMRHQIQTLNQFSTEPVPVKRVEYGWRFGGRENHVAVTAPEPQEVPCAGSEEEFIAEHYWGYTARRPLLHRRGKAGGEYTSEYRVEHPKWLVSTAVDYDLECDAAALYGEPFAEVLNQKPSSSFLAAGSQVNVLAGEKLNTHRNHAS